GFGGGGRGGGGGFGGGGGGRGGGGGFGGGGRGGGGRGGGGRGGSGGSEEGFAEQAEERAQELIDKIKNVVEPDTWDDAGGLGKIEAYGSQIIVYNTYSVHELLGGPFLADE
ncbi:MAG: hypothetical protein IID39_04300, partial [Planctomycetes bacterium]|nr:hypothetical protein [Planctomycetota bacterium]